MDLHKLHTTLKKQYKQNKNLYWKCDICNEYYTIQNKYYHLDTIKHRDNIKKYIKKHNIL